MKCTQARELIALQPDKRLSTRNLARLDEHIRQCRGCRAYRQSLTCAVSAMEMDASSSLLDAAPSRNFDDRLHAALMEEARKRTPRHVGAVRRFLAPLFLPISIRPQRTARAAAILLLLFCVTLCVTLAALHEPDHTCSNLHFGHLAAFSARTAPDGRVYASLTERNSRTHCDLSTRRER